ncbi:hypothetical protein CEXT_367271 [Caerostris extrusa]|uniref:Secreted protein n=1 Tax=Caerostris extrusa TaxID=172846 RepID=A0AAV4UE20_CAEEX|nr:hypothetical protein CEXT_367271 [Caerostris extrusa]
MDNHFQVGIWTVVATFLIFKASGCTLSLCLHHDYLRARHCCSNFPLYRTSVSTSVLANTFSRSITNRKRLLMAAERLPQHQSPANMIEESLYRVNCMEYCTRICYPKTIRFDAQTD